MRNLRQLRDPRLQKAGETGPVFFLANHPAPKGYPVLQDDGSLEILVPDKKNKANPVFTGFATNGIGTDDPIRVAFSELGVPDLPLTHGTSNAQHFLLPTLDVVVLSYALTTQNVLASIGKGRTEYAQDAKFGIAYYWNRIPRDKDKARGRKPEDFQEGELRSQSNVEFYTVPLMFLRGTATHPINDPFVDDAGNPLSLRVSEHGMAVTHLLDALDAYNQVLDLLWSNLEAVKAYWLQYGAAEEEAQSLIDHLLSDPATAPNDGNKTGGPLPPYYIYLRLAPSEKPVGMTGGGQTSQKYIVVPNFDTSNPTLEDALSLLLMPDEIYRLGPMVEQQQTWSIERSNDQNNKVRIPGSAAQDSDSL